MCLRDVSFYGRGFESRCRVSRPEINKEEKTLLLPRKLKPLPLEE